MIDKNLGTNFLFIYFVKGLQESIKKSKIMKKNKSKLQTKNCKGVL